MYNPIIDKNKDKRISFLSVFSSLCNNNKIEGSKEDGKQLYEFMEIKQIVVESFNVVDKLFKMYPLEEEMVDANEIANKEVQEVVEKDKPF